MKAGCDLNTAVYLTFVQMALLSSFKKLRESKNELYLSLLVVKKNANI